MHAALLNSPGLQYVRKPTPALLAVVGDEWATKVYASAVAVYTAVQRDAMSLQKWQTAVHGPTSWPWNAPLPLAPI